MNEEFAIQLKMVMDQSSIAQVKEQLKVIEQIGGGLDIPTARVTQVFDVDNAREYTAEINYLLFKIDELSETIRAMHEHPELWSEEAMLKAEMDLDRLLKKLERLQGGEEEETGFFSFSETIISVKNNMGEVLKKVGRLGGALLGIASIYGSIRKAMSTYLSQNDELQQKINACWYALGSLFAPVVEFLVDLFVKLVSLVDIVARALGFAGINMDNFGKKAGKASKQLAGFDEINNLTEQSGSGFANPFGNFELGDKFKDFANLIQGNIDLLKLMGIGAMFGIGVALLFTGHPLSGLGMILAAGVLTYKEIAPNWDYLVEKVGGVRNAIMAIVSGFSIGLGAILLFTGHPAIGLGLLMTGLATASTLVDWSFIPTKALEVISTIMTILSVASVAIGFLLLLTGNPAAMGIGIAMIIGGIGVGMATYKMKTDYLSGEVSTALNNVQGEIDSKMPVIESSVTGAWDDIYSDTDHSWGNIENNIFGSLKDINKESTSQSSNILSKFLKMNSSLTGDNSRTWTSIASFITSKMDNIRSQLGIKWNSLSSWWSGLSLSGFHIKLPHLSWSYDGWMGLPRLNVDWYAKGGIFTAPSVIGVGEYSGAGFNPEVVAPLNTLSDMIGDNSRIEGLLEQLIDVVDTKEFRAYISQNEIGKTAVKYINSQSRIKGGSIV